MTRRTPKPSPAPVERAAEIRKLTQLAVTDGRPLRLLACRCGDTRVVDGDAPDSTIDGCPRCRECPEWPYTVTLDRRPVQIQVETNPDRDGRQVYLVNWIQPGGVVRSQVFRGRVEQAVELWQQEGNSVVVLSYAPGVRAPATVGA